MFSDMEAPVLKQGCCPAPASALPLLFLDAPGSSRNVGLFSAPGSSPRFVGGFESARLIVSLSCNTSSTWLCMRLKRSQVVVTASAMQQHEARGQTALPGRLCWGDTNDLQMRLSSSGRSMSRKTCLSLMLASKACVPLGCALCTARLALLCLTFAAKSEDM